MPSFASGYIKYINHLEQINDGAVLDPEKMITEVEESYHDHLRNIARSIISYKNNVKLCMLSGPSSSGKTTTAHLLQEYLREMGKVSYIVSMDNYYLSNDSIPVLFDGSKDFETVNALDIGKIQDCIKNIVENGIIEIPKFDFTAGRPVEPSSFIDIDHGDIVIMEGIHALNPVFTKSIDKNRMIKLYVSVKQSIEDANREVINPLDLRLIRRIVRDMQFRGTDPERTLEMWDNVVKGENNYIKPYRLSADYTVNSIHLYEPCVLRTMAIPTLRAIAEDSLFYRKARDLESRLMRFEPIPCALVPQKSMLREFIGDKM